MTTVAKSMVLMTVVAGLLFSPTDLSSCGPFLTTALFSFTRQPEQPRDKYARGQLGILQSSYPRFYLYIAYRYLIGVPLSADEQRALFPPQQNGPPERWSAEWKTTVPHIVDEWLDARKKVAVEEPPRIAVERTITTPTEYVQYTNCLDDAFRSASATLAARIAKFGAASPVVKEWLAGQDLVFANCAGEPPVSIPAALPLDSDPVLKADRAYQIAAAHMYAGDFDEAENGFRQIAADKSSSWRETSAYAIARVLIRKSTVKNDAAAMAKAEAQLQSVIGDPSLAPVQAAARNLLEFVRARLHPEDRLRELAQILVKSDAALHRDLTDYRFLYDRLEDKFGDAKTMVRSDDLSDWLWSFHYNPPGRAIRMWHTKQTLPWLIATLEYLQKNDPAVGEAIRAADKLKPDSPAYATAAFHVSRLLIDAHQDKSARDRLDSILRNRAQFPVSSVNLFLAERMKVAANWNEFLQYAQRVPAGVSFDEDSDAATEPDQNNPLKAFASGRTALDADGARILNEQTPLKLIASAAADTSLSPELRTDIALAAWTRAVLLDDAKVAADLSPALKDAAIAYRSESDPARKKFSGIYFMLKHPGVRPYAETGFGRLTALDKIDDFRDNWWCALSAGEQDGVTSYYRIRSAIESPLKLLYATDQPAASFLSSADRSQGAAEWKKLASLPAAPNYLTAQVIGYAQAHPEDPRSPEALFLAVRSTRYGCTDAKTGPLSKQAYDLLHQKYPDSDWAKQTRYWYK